jgi:hypothetical protein
MPTIVRSIQQAYFPVAGDEEVILILSLFHNTYIPRFLFLSEIKMRLVHVDVLPPPHVWSLSLAFSHAQLQPQGVQKSGDADSKAHHNSWVRRDFSG